MFGIFGKRNRMAGDALQHASPWVTPGIASSGDTTPSGHAAPWGSAAPEPQASVSPVDAAAAAAPWVASSLPDLLPEVRAPLTQRLATGAGKFFTDNSKLIGRGGLGLGALGLAASAAGELSNPNESKLNNLAGAAGTVAGGGAGLALGGAIGAGIAGSLSGPLAPFAMPIGAAIGSTVLGSAANAVSRGVASLWEDPAAKALRQQVALRDAERNARIKDLEAMLPYEYEAAEMKAALQQRIAAQQAELQNQQLLQQGLVQSMADRTRGQQAWDNTLAAGIMNTLVG